MTRLRTRPGNPVVTKRRSDGVVQGYHVSPQVTENVASRDAFYERPKSKPFTALVDVPASPVEPDLRGAREHRVDHRRRLFVTDERFALAEWNGREYDYRVTPRTPELDAAVRRTHPEVLDD